MVAMVYIYLYMNKWLILICFHLRKYTNRPMGLAVLLGFRIQATFSKAPLPQGFSAVAISRKTHPKLQISAWCQRAGGR